MSIPLTVVLEGETRTIEDFRDAEDMKRYLRDLGSIKGEKIRVAGGNVSGMILMVKGVRIALNQELASKIIVGD